MPLYTSYPKDEYTLLKKPIQQAIQRVLDSGIYVLGKEVASFEQEFAHYSGLKYAIGVGNGTDALFISLKALGVGPGDEVITTPMTAAYTAFAVIYAGAAPVFVDVHPDTYEIDETQLERAITKRTKAIIPVHLFGQPCNIVAIMKIAKRHKLKVIEDCCQAHGAQIGKRRVGTFGDVACYSFYPTKNLGGIGDGGAVLTNNKALAAKIRLLHNGHQTSKYYHTAVGHNTRLDELQAAILRVKLQQLDQFIAKRQAVAAAYDRWITNPKIIKPVVTKGVRHVFHLYVIQTAQRDTLQQRLAKAGIVTQVHYPWPLHKLPAFDFLKKAYRLPHSERMSQRALSLPMYPGLTQANVRQICRIVNQ
ncbi:MAG TPA: erythromycin biosynthesis sensory transduction protein eryC1 [Candidatus Kerfeldbacteria bacterium]|nr:erythromycin biosynthesis sensory transduction protein eryC1 [Candidatus Kerfeldbacteria bacterium]